MSRAFLLVVAVAATATADTIVSLHPSKPTLSKADVLTLASEWGSRRRSATINFVVQSDVADARYEVTHVVDVEGWGLVVIGESGDGGTAYLASANASAATHLSVRHGGRRQKVHALNGTPLKQSLVSDASDLPNEAAPIVGTTTTQLDRRRVCPPQGGKTVIRVGVLHTPDVLALDYYAGSSEAVRAEVAVAVTEGNAVAFPLSGVDIEIRLCANELLPAPSLEKSSARATLSAFGSSARVEQIRQRNTCDTMVLFSTLAGLGNSACGIGYLPGDHAVVAADCFVDNYSFLHEFGHNLGACHGPPSRRCGAGANGYGDAANDFRTILAYRAICGMYHEGNCTRVPRFSNKKSAFSWKGEAIGDASSDNAWILNANKEEAARRVC